MLEVLVSWFAVGGSTGVESFVVDRALWSELELVFSLGEVAVFSSS